MCLHKSGERFQVSICAGPSDGHVGLALFAPVPEWVQELRVHSRQASQVLKASISSVLRLLWRR